MQAFEHGQGCDIIMSPPEQQSGGGMHEVCEVHHKEMQTD